MTARLPARPHVARLRDCAGFTGAQRGRRRRNQRGWRDYPAARDRYHGPDNGADVRLLARWPRQLRRRPGSSPGSERGSTRDEDDGAGEPQVPAPGCPLPAAEAGIVQFLDIGTGLPTQGNVHQVAQQVTPDARVVYADNDRCKWCCAHAVSYLERVHRSGQRVGRVVVVHLST
jgi:hypothetical protein